MAVSSRDLLVLSRTGQGRKGSLFFINTQTSSSSPLPAGCSTTSECANEVFDSLPITGLPTSLLRYYRQRDSRLLPLAQRKLSWYSTQSFQFWDPLPHRNVTSTAIGCQVHVPLIFHGYAVISFTSGCIASSAGLH